MGAAVTPTVIRAVPRDRDGWRVAADRVAVLLAEACDAGLPATDARRAWHRLDAAVQDAQDRPGYPPGPCPDLCLVPVVPADLGPLAGAAALLGRGLLPAADPRIVVALARTSARCRTAPGTAVRELARAHGVLDLHLGTDGELLYALAGIAARSPGMRVVAARVAGRVGPMWAAGGEHPHAVGPAPVG
ncbi:hypothetical protein [Pseudonocardia phyllosphaerae]|uniref:hypothetical protein n=1 Tax=Pseudonocardia phyllosphaerae TaxID=3390502 RepID=UPI00397BD068